MNIEELVWNLLEGLYDQFSIGMEFNFSENFVFLKFLQPCLILRI